MRIDIRPAIYSDTEKLTAIKLRARGESTNPNSSLYSRELEYITSFLDERRDIFIMMCDRNIIAYCATQICPIRQFDDCIEIKDLYVLPEYQNKGYGKKLLSHALRKMRVKGYMHAFLNTAEGNVKARCFYEKFGFKPYKKSDTGIVYVTYVIDF